MAMKIVAERNNCSGCEPECFNTTMTSGQLKLAGQVRGPAPGRRWVMRCLWA